jgi:hypothetical protein
MEYDDSLAGKNRFELAEPFSFGYFSGDSCRLCKMVELSPICGPSKAVIAHSCLSTYGGLERIGHE